MSGGRLVVVVRVTERCNLSCGFCAYDRRLPFRRRELDATLLLRFAQALAEHRQSSGRDVHLSLLGGEPLLYAPLARLEPALAALGLSLGVTTNGTSLARPGTRDRLLRYYDELTLSIDALGSTHDRLRGWPGGYTQLERALARLIADRSLRGSPLRLRVNTILMRSTFRHFRRLCERLAELGIDELTVNQLGGLDRPEFYAGECIPREDLDGLLAELRELQASLSRRGVLLRGGPDYFARMAHTTERSPLPVLDCRPGESFLFVDERGRVSPCSFTSSEYGVPVATLSRAEDVRALGPRFRAARQGARAAACDDCRSTQVFAKWSLPVLQQATRTTEEACPRAS